MKIEIIGKGFEITSAMKDATLKKLERINDLFTGNPEATVVYSAHQTNQSCEITIRDRKNVLRAKTRGESAYECLDLTLDKLEGQIRKVKTQLGRSKKKSSFSEVIRFDLVEEEAQEERLPVNIVRHKTLAPDHLDAEEAIARMDALGHSFYIYIDSASGNTCVLYTRDDGGFGVIEVKE